MSTPPAESHSPPHAAPAARCDPARKKKVSLPVLPPDKTHTIGGRPTKIARSRTGRWRAAVLIGVHIVIAIHILLWLVFGMTVSPVEPSEAMYTLENGLVNAGFIFFILAILSTFIFGRFFCGWACHVVALQDLCSWFMNKLGVRPKPFRSRLLIFVPLILAGYMFIWPTFKREVVKPVAGEHWTAIQPYLGEAPDFPGWTNHLVVDDFWKTFPPWYIAIPFLAVCGFGAVYFLGSKGFCTYGCPYAGFFAPVDKLALGRIRVTDACEQCGHCTAVCSSNVRVHEEVRDFGMVVDPGCMKCMDCVSVCPNDALYFGFGKPQVFTAPRNEEARARRAGFQRHYDLTRRQEWLVAGAFLLLFFGFRGMFNQVPLLMAVGMAGIGAFCTWKLLEVLRAPHSRLQSLQLKYRGRLKLAGMIFLPLVLAYVGAGAWGAVVKYHAWRGEIIEWDINTPREVAFAPGYVPDPQVKAIADRAIRAFKLAGPPAQGGIGWRHRGDRLVRLAYLSMVAGDPEAAEGHIREVLATGKPNDDLIIGLGQIMSLRGRSHEDVLDEYRRVLQQHPHLLQIRFMLADRELRAGNRDAAVALYESALSEKSLRFSARLRVNAASVAFAAGRPERGIELAQEAVRLARGHEAVGDIRAAAMVLVQNRLPDLAEQVLTAAAEGRRRTAAPIHHDLALLAANQQRMTDAIAAMQLAAELDPRFVPAITGLADLYARAGRAAEALAQTRRAAELDPANPLFAAAVAEMAARAGELAEAVTWAAKAAALAPAEPSLAALCAEISLAAGDAAAAKQWAVKVAELAPADPGAAQFCAGIHAQAGDPALAQQWAAEAQRRAAAAQGRQ